MSLFFQAHVNFLHTGGKQITTFVQPVSHTDLQGGTQRDDGHPATVTGNPDRPSPNSAIVTLGIMQQSLDTEIGNTGFEITE